MINGTLDETSPELQEALASTLGLVFGQETLSIGPTHTGGGVMVCTIDLTLDGRGIGRQAWLTRDAGTWLLGFYDFALDPDDEGIVVALLPHDTPDGSTVDSALWIAGQVAGILTRLGVTTLQGQ